ncbi:trans-3-hydroxy-L-proline dehydratase [Planobispora rosea]|uniref:Trans-3-hydroxy-L-proline dehydratase n=1 Tax=Planobispora rosea TaxID=35762 RepID=A0A8J3RY69_PLARO|nr:proline racemase family protein [Planobispora rosea]GGS73651.1 trans-3-hydroxy-L-proline dehydratase [Planobispora rosea]GIH81639.1 trans-3-hydroxy-L-proline dehydratase [Planobispora rosea]
MRIREISTTDYHTAGEPFRIVGDPPVAIEGATVAEKRMFAISDPHVNGLRRLLCFEPRGHADMYGGFLTAPDDEGAHFGVLFWHKDGFSTACGHGTIALGVWALHSGLVEPDPSGTTEVRVDVPSGRVTARVRTSGDRVTGVDFVSVPSYRLHQRVEISTSRGEVVVDVGFGGATYAHLDASSIGLSVVPENYTELIAAGREIKWLLDDTAYAAHPLDDRLSGVYGTILFEDLGTDEAGNVHQRNVTVFADGEVDRSPCGSGTCSRVAVLASDGVLRPGRQLVHDSIVGTRFHARIAGELTVAGRRAVIPEVTGMAFRTGRHTFEIDPEDSLGEGFVLR